MKRLFFGTNDSSSSSLFLKNISCILFSSVYSSSFFFKFSSSFLWINVPFVDGFILYFVLLFKKKIALVCLNHTCTRTRSVLKSKCGLNKHCHYHMNKHCFFFHFFFCEAIKFFQEWWDWINKQLSEWSECI